MSDITDQSREKQVEILLLKSTEERFKIGDEFSSFGRKILENSIRNEFPGISEIALKTEVFKRCYSSQFSPEELNRIVDAMQTFLLHNNG